MKFAIILILLIASSIASSSAFSAELKTKIDPAEEAAQNEARIAFNIRPLAMMYGIYGAEIQAGITDAITLGANFQWFHDARATRVRDIYETSVLGTYHFSGLRFEQGWLAELSLNVDSSSATRSTGVPITTAFPTDGTYLLPSLNYLWSWKNGILCQLGAGVSFDLTHQDQLLEMALLWKLGIKL